MFGDEKKVKCEIKDHNSPSQQKQEGAEWTWWSSWKESEGHGDLTSLRIDRYS